MLSRRNFLKTQAAGVALPLAMAVPAGKNAAAEAGRSPAAGLPDPGLGQPRLIDCHHHYNGDPTYVEKVVAKLESVDGMALLLTKPSDLDSAKRLIDKYPKRLVGIGEIDLDAPDAAATVDRVHDLGFRGLGELENPTKFYNDPSYWPIYERAEKYHMICLFHTGIVNRLHPEIPENVSVERMRATQLDLIARSFPNITVIGAHLGNPDYDWAAEIARWNANLYFDLSGSTLIKKQNDYTYFNKLFWWSGVVSPHSPAGGPHAFEKLVFGSDCFAGDLDEFDLELSRYQKMLEACNIPAKVQANIFSGTLWRILNKQS